MKFVKWLRCVFNGFVAGRSSLTPVISETTGGDVLISGGVNVKYNPGMDKNGVTEL